MQSYAVWDVAYWFFRGGLKQRRQVKLITRHEWSVRQVADALYALESRGDQRVTEVTIVSHKRDVALMAA